MNKKGLKIVFLGTPEFGIRPLETLIEDDFNVIGVITAPDKPVGRKLATTPSPVKISAKKHGIPIYQPGNKPELLLGLKELKPDLCIVAAFGMILTEEMLEIPEYGFINIHASLLPKWRGASPIQSAILAGDQKTGVTIMLVNEKMDTGPILAQRELEYPRLRQGFGGQAISKLTYKELEEKLSELGAKLIIEAITKFINGEIKAQPQDESRATYCKKITKEDGLVDLGKEPPEIIERKIRAFIPWPGVYFFSKGKRIIIAGAELKKCNTCGESDSSQLKIKRVKPEGKSEMDFGDYLKGNPNKELEKYL